MIDKEIFRLVASYDKESRIVSAHGWSHWQHEDYRSRIILPMNGLYREADSDQVKYALTRLSHGYIKHIENFGFKEVYYYD